MKRCNGINHLVSFVLEQIMKVQRFIACGFSEFGSVRERLKTAWTNVFCVFFASCEP